MNLLWFLYSIFTELPVQSNRKTRSVMDVNIKTATDWVVRIKAILVRKAPPVAAIPLVLVLAQGPFCYALAPTKPQAQTQTKVAELHEPAQPESTVPVADVGPTASTAPSPSTPVADPGVALVLEKELATMKARMEQISAQLAEMKGRAVATGASPVAESPARLAEALPVAAPAEAAVLETSSASSAAEPEKPEPSVPFAFADWTWLNGNARNKDAVWDSKFFTPEIRFDTHFVSSLNHPKDDSLGGSTEIFRSNEIQLEQISVGGDFHWQNVRGRILTMGGMFAVTTPRNDASVGRGQWDLRGAYKYFSEAYGGYHFNVNHGLNVDAGIFVSYIGLFSYYNFDNWAYQPSYVSSNTPWFFNGLRIQYFPTAKLKIEPWIINGWQSYARTNSKPGLGGQILWRPKPYLSLVFNNYGMGTDVLGAPGVSRIHTDDSVEVREYNKPDKFLDMMAMSITGDLGCQYGGGFNCFNDKNGGGKSAFLGWMAYQRFQFKHDTYGITLGGGQMSNPGRYLTLLPPINGADAISGSPYFTANLGDKAHMYDATATFDYMPSQWITFRTEMGYRHSDVPYWSGRGGITPPGGLNNASGNTGAPASYVCTNGLSSIVSNFVPSGVGFFDSSSVTPSGDNGGPQNSGGAVDNACNTQAT